MPNLRWGLISTADINRRLIPAIRASERGELTAVCSRTPEKANSYAAKWDIPYAFGSYQEMLDSDTVDVVYNSLPNHLHAEWSIKAMEAGKYVLCEKPFVITMDEMDEMTAVSERTGFKLAEAFMYRHHPQTKIVGEWVQSGRLGEIRLVRATFNATLGDPGNVRYNPDWGGGALWDVGIYPVSYCQYIMGEAPQEVLGSQWLGETGVDIHFYGQMAYSQDRYAQISCSFAAPFYTQTEIYGSKGRLVSTRPFVTMEHGRQLTFYPEKGDPQEIPVPEKELYLGEVEDMHAAILDGEPNYLTLAETRNHVRTALALYESAEKGRVVEL
ncbi:MAG: Gfo/Idh/MocA family oxidoreductase [Candidatus Promineifilaceae bacterium]